MVILLYCYIGKRSQNIYVISLLVFSYSLLVFSYSLLVFSYSLLVSIIKNLMVTSLENLWIYKLAEDMENTKHKLKTKKPKPVTK